MKDIVERLRDPNSSRFLWEDDGSVERLMQEAADEIERLRRDFNGIAVASADEIERLRRDVQNLNRDCMSLAGDNGRLRRIEAAYNNILQAERDLRRAQWPVDSD